MADEFTRANPVFINARRLGSAHLPLAAGEVAESGRLPFLSVRDVAALAALVLAGWAFLSLVERFF